MAAKRKLENSKQMEEMALVGFSGTEYSLLQVLLETMTRMRQGDKLQVYNRICPTP
jgi:hypothetical protein